uniref:Rab3 GTPase-activating protein catalytic subunit n=1 Tax=Macrostomum lignano TaxID=282301 RepID=A0A1I8JRA1_9PLAT
SQWSASRQVTNDPEEFQEMIEDIFVQGGGLTPRSDTAGHQAGTGGCHSALLHLRVSPTPARKIRNCLTQFLNSFNGKRVWFLFSLEIA